VASRSEHRDTLQPESIEELLDALDELIDRLKVLYEQYFMGIQKQAPAYMHTDVERRLRDLMQLQIRNTGLRFRLATLQQKFGAYNTYWRRTLRQIENGTYIRNLSKIGRDAARTGAAIPEEILRAMPKRMREQVMRDREQAMIIAARRGGVTAAQDDEELLTLLPEGAPPPEHAQDPIAVIREPSDLRRHLKTQAGAHVIDEKDADLDLNSFFDEVEHAPAAPAPAPPPRPKPPSAPPAPAPLRAASISGQLPMVKPPSPAMKPPVAAATLGAPRPKVTPPKSNVPAIAKAPSQITKPNPIAPGSAAARPPVDAEPLVGPFPKETSKPPPAKPPSPPPKPAPPPGMSDADVTALYSTYVKAKELLGEQVGPNGRDKLLKTINAQAPKIMEQYKATGVSFSVVVKDNQVVIRAKPKP
jgi:hypothetical protein